MDVAQQRDIDRPSAQRWPRWQNLRGVFDNEFSPFGGVSDGESTGFVFYADPAVNNSWIGKNFDSPNECKGDDSQTEAQARSLPPLLLYLQNHTPCLNIHQ
ncbi:hypothetical protein NP493_5702g00004 [Ridgeia piscesae]|uniref:Uncharacterized protein n=1 Tax=Ridgeia piscesae TaxID=27915 RepID=A0AAD9MPH2_RIDPI|nr:hypothetical protein NP493_5702g00004 [Ridgeia piscesae]